MWNYRIVAWKDDHSFEEESLLEIREVYYDVDGVPYAHGGASILSENFSGLHDVMDMMALAFTKNTLTYPEIGRAHV